MRIVDFLAPGAVVELVGAGPGEALAELAIPLAQATGLDARRVEQVLVAREARGSTAVGEGCAVPHGRVDDLERIVGAFGRSRKGVAFAAGDGQPVHLFFALLAPARTPASYLNVLALVSRSLKDPARRQALLDAQDAPGVYRVLEGMPDGGGAA